MAAPGVVLADLPDQETLLAEERVRERALPDAGRADEGDGSARAEERADGIEALPADRAGGDDWHAGRDLRELGLGDGHLDGVAGEVDLGEDDDRPGTGLPGGGEEALHATHVQVAVERGRDRTTSTLAASTWNGAP